MKIAAKLAVGAALLASASAMSFAASAKDVTVGVSWSNFQEERWKTDEAAIKEALDKAGGRSTSRPTRRPRPPSSSPTSRA